jgi:hypothetical protein
MKHKCAYAPDPTKEVTTIAATPITTKDPFTSADLVKEKAREICPYCKVVMIEL